MFRPNRKIDVERVATLLKGRTVNVYTGKPVKRQIWWTGTIDQVSGDYLILTDATSFTGRQHETASLHRQWITKIEVRK